jgi:hypothetical protein
VEIFQFDRREKVIEYFGSRGLRATRIAAGAGTGLVAIAVEGAPMSLFEPEEPELPSVP